MNIGVTFPQTEFGNDTGAIREFAQTAEALGYSHILVYDHVVGAVHEHRDPPLTGPYTEKTPFHEPFVLMGYLAAVTTTIGLATGIIILPQRQAVLVAKQAAEVDILSGERLRLGIGSGWNYVEYEALGEDWDTRGPRYLEQIDLLRRLWTQPVVDYRGEFHRVDRAGILPLPNRSIPIWMGGFHERVFRRAAALADGFIFNAAGPRSLAMASQVRAYVAEAGRNPDAFGIEVFLEYRRGPYSWGPVIDSWREAGATHVCLNTMGAGLTTAAAHIDAMRTFASTVGLKPGR